MVIVLYYWSERLSHRFFCGQVCLKVMKLLLDMKSGSIVTREGRQNYTKQFLSFKLAYHYLSIVLWHKFCLENVRNVGYCPAWKEMHMSRWFNNGLDFPSIKIEHNLRCRATCAFFLKNIVTGQDFLYYGSELLDIRSVKQHLPHYRLTCVIILSKRS